MHDNLMKDFQQRLDALLPQAAALGVRVCDWGNAVEFHDGFSRPADFSTDYVHFYTNYLIAIGQADLADIMTKISALDGQELDEQKYAIDYLVSMLESRLTYLTDKTPPPRVLSLGRDCLPRSVPTKWGIKPPRNLGELATPFDLAMHPPEAVADILESNFANYFDDITWSETLGHPVSEPRGIMWNHETGLEWAKQDFARLIERYHRRIANLRQVLNDGRPTVLVLYINEAFTHGMLEVVRRIARATRRLGTNPLSMAVFMSSQDSILPVDTNYAQHEMVDGVPVALMPAPLPYPWYMWFEHKHFTLPGGKEFETRITEGVRKSFTTTLAPAR